MNNIDFLPQKYRDNDARRREGVWRLLVALLFGGVIAAASVAQLGYRARVKSQLEEVQPMLAQAQAREAHLAKMRGELADVNTTANLHALVQTPWPRTQILAAIVESLEESIVLESINLTHREDANAASTTTRGEQFAPAKEPGAEATTPARWDLDLLQAQLFRRRTVVSLSGLTAQQSQLHAYLARLELSPLVSGVELLDVDSVPAGNGSTQLRFRAEAEIRSPMGRGDDTSGEGAAHAGRSGGPRR